MDRLANLKILFLAQIKYVQKMKLYFICIITYEICIVNS